MKRLIAVVALITLVVSVPIPAMAGKWAKGLYAKTITDEYIGLLQPLLVRVRGFDPPALKQNQLFA